MFEDMFEHYYYEQEEEAEEEAIILKMNLNNLTDDDLLTRILDNSSVSRLNKVTMHFPAGDVAIKYKENGWNLSKKQRDALTNVYVYTQTGVNPRRL